MLLSSLVCPVQMFHVLLLSLLLYHLNKYIVIVIVIVIVIIIIINSIAVGKNEGTTATYRFV